MIQDRVPNVRPDVGPHVLIQALSRAASMLTNFKRFPDFNVIGEAAFLFSLHFSYDFEVSAVKVVMAVLVVLSNARVGPLFVIDGSAMLFPSLLKGPSCLSHINRLIGAVTSIFVDTFGFFRVGSCFVVGA